MWRVDDRRVQAVGVELDKGRAPEESALAIERPGSELGLVAHHVEAMVLRSQLKKAIGLADLVVVASSRSSRLGRFGNGLRKQLAGLEIDRNDMPIALADDQSPLVMRQELGRQELGPRPDGRAEADPFGSLFSCSLRKSESARHSRMSP